MTPAQAGEIGGGLVLLAATFYDLFQTVVLPRPAVHKLALVRYMLRAIWRSWRWIGERIDRQPRRAPVPAHAQAAEGEVELVVDDDGSLQRHPVLVAERLRRRSRVVHEGLRLGQDQLIAAGRDPRGQRFRRPVFELDVAAGGELVDHPEAEVVAGGGVLGTGIAQPDDQPPVLDRLHRLAPEHGA